MPWRYPKRTRAKRHNRRLISCARGCWPVWSDRLSAMPDEGARVTVVRNGDGWTIAGEIDAHSAPSLAAALSELPAVSQVVADFTGVTFMDSSGLRVLLDAAMKATGVGKTFAISHPQAAIKRVVEISGLTAHLHFLD